MVTEVLFRTVERLCRIINKGSDSGVGETWCDSLNYCFENILSPLPYRVVYLPSTLMVSFSHVTCFEMLAVVMGTEA